MEPGDGERSGGGRTFDRTEAERVLGRAAALQAAASSDSVTLEALGDAAADVGIDRALVRRAANELAIDPSPAERRFGMQTRVTRRRWLDRGMTRSDFERAHARLDTFFGAQGQRTVSEDAASWTARHVVVTFERSDDGTMIVVSERFSNTAQSMAALAIAGGGGAGLTLSLALLAPFFLGPAAMPIAMIMAALTGMGTLRWAQYRHAALIERTGTQFERALDMLEASVVDR